MLRSTASDVAQSLINVGSDPCLATVAQQLNDLHLLESSGDGGPTQAAAGIGLCYAVTPLKFLVWARQNPWVFLAFAGTVVGSIGYVGYRVGKRIHGGRGMAGLGAQEHMFSYRNKHGAWSNVWATDAEEAKQKAKARGDVGSFVTISRVTNVPPRDVD